MTDVRWERYPLVGAHPLARGSLQLQADLGLATNTIAVYGRALQEYLSSSAHTAAASEAARRGHLAACVRGLTTRPRQRGARGRGLDAGAGLANATLQQRLVAVRLF
jgi:integrase/recombinase XerD